MGTLKIDARCLFVPINHANRMHKQKELDLVIVYNSIILSKMQYWKRDTSRDIYNSELLGMA